MSAAISVGTARTYNRAWELFCMYFITCIGGLPIIPISVQCLGQFIAWLHQKGYASSTITTYISALGYQHKMQGFGDPSQSFFIQKLLTGARRSLPRFDTRLPLSKEMLTTLVARASQLPLSSYRTTMLRCMFLIAFHAFARIGEITVSHGQNNVLHFKDVKLTVQSAVQTLLVTFRNFKHNNLGRPFTIILKNQPDINFCPVRAFISYASLRGNKEGPLFLDQNKSPVNRSQFTGWLKAALSYCGLDPAMFKGHSFRIGAATHAAEKGMSDAQIRQLGRWKSNAFQKYIRPVND